MPSFRVQQSRQAILAWKEGSTAELPHSGALFKSSKDKKKAPGNDEAKGNASAHQSRRDSHGPKSAPLPFDSAHFRVA